MVTKKSPAKQTRHTRPIRSGKNSTFGERIAERMHSGFARLFTAKRATATGLGVVAAIAVIGGVLLWYNKSYTDPKNVFFSMLDNNLSTHSVTKEINQQSTGASSNELIQLAFSPQPIVRDIRKVNTETQVGSGRVTIESIGTSKDTFQRYVLIDQQSDSSKAKVDYSKIYGLWIRSSGSQQAESPQIFNDAMFGTILFGNFSLSSREDIKKHLEDAYKTDFSKVKKERIDGRRVYTYEIKVALSDYARAVKLYAKQLGLSNADQLNPDSYSPSDQIPVVISVDMLSRQVKKLVYSSSGQVENYNGYGIITDIKAPSHTVGYPALQKAIDEASK